jgi:glycosyltransferase involved in cell wall biosynthesis
MTAGKIKLLVASEPGTAGVKRHVFDCLDTIDLARFDVTFAYSVYRADPDYARLRDILARRGIVLHELTMTNRLTPWADLRAIVQAARLIASLRPDIVHAHSSKAGLVFRLGAALARTGVRVIYSPHAMAAYFSVFYHAVERFLGFFADLILAVSPSERDDLVRWKIKPPNRIRVLTMGIRPATVRAAPVSPPVIAASGRMCRQKNALLFFEAMELVAARVPVARFRWIGAPDHDRETRAVENLLANSPHRARFEITGWLDDPRPALAEASLFCMLSRYESFGYVTADALQMGLAVIGLAATGTRDLVHPGETGLIVAPTATAIADAVCALLANPDVGRQLGEGARRLIEQNHALEPMIRQLESIYTELARTKSKTA